MDFGELQRRSENSLDQSQSQIVSMILYLSTYKTGSNNIIDQFNGRSIWLADAQKYGQWNLETKSTRTNWNVKEQLGILATTDIKYLNIIYRFLSAY